MNSTADMHSASTDSAPAPDSPNAHAEGAGHGVIVAGPGAKAAAQEAPQTVSQPEPGVGVIVAGPAARGDAPDPVKPACAGDDLGRADSFGVAAFGRYPGRRFEDVEAEMSRHWASSSGESNVTWDQARSVARDAWHRVSRSAAG